MAKKFIPIDRTLPITLPANMDGWLDPNSLAYFVVDVVNQLDLTDIEDSYSPGGSLPYPPSIMVSLLFYGYAKGIFSSRKLEAATYELIPMIYICGGTHPDHTSISSFRKRFMPQLKGLFVDILMYASELGVLQLGDISIDGTKIQANASKHKAMSWDYAQRLEEQLTQEVEQLLAKAEESSKGVASEINIPEEIERRESRLGKIAQIKAEIERRAQERYEQEQSEYEAKLEERANKEAKLGRKLGGRKPTAPVPGPRGKDQVSFTDGDSRIMPTSGGSFEQAYNAQASVDMDTMLIVGAHVSQKTNDKQEVAPALNQLDALPDQMGQVKRAALDSGYFSETNSTLLEEHEIDAYIATGRQSHNLSLEQRLASEPEPPTTADVKTQMTYRLQTEEGKAFYAKRKSTVEPVFGIIKEAMGFRRFLLRGLEAVEGEWTLVCIAFNLKRLCQLAS